MVMGKMYIIVALTEMVLFYAVYFGKMLAQRRRGIRTRQLGKGSRKDFRVRRTEIAVSVATLAVVPVQLVSILCGLNHAPECLRIVGAVLGLAGDVVFLVAAVTMRESWRAGIPYDDKTALVTTGIYTYSRNPAFVGFDLMYTGLMFMYLNVVLSVCTVLTVVALHAQILREEDFLRGTFGEQYIAYQKHTARYFGRKFWLRKS